MEQFPHLKFIQKIDGKPRINGGGRRNPLSNQNRADRSGHSAKLQRWVTACKSDWETSFDLRESNGLAELDSNIQPVYLKINPDIINSVFDLEAFGIEVISEEEDGFIIGASLDNFRSLEEKINDFTNSVHSSGKIADFWEIVAGNREVWKPKHILSEELYAKWGEIQDDQTYKLEVSIAFNKPLKPAPNPNVGGYQRKLAEYERKRDERDDLLSQRESHFQEFINTYGIITSSLIQLDDSFACEVEISGKGLKDLVVNYQFVFEVLEIEEVGDVSDTEEVLSDSTLELISPDEDAIEVGIIDSGIMEGNRYLSPAIKPNKSKSYLPNDTSTADHSTGGGHGTKVAGAVLFPNGVSSLTSPYKLPFYIRNLRILNANTALVERYPAELMKQIVSDNSDCSIFNLSLGSNSPFRKRHMSTWAAIIDNLIYEKNVLFLIATGNVRFPHVRNYLNNGTNYPDYLNEPFCQLSNPSQSCFGLTVGSINHTSFNDGNWESIGVEQEISGYSRIGSGIWGQIKPDVVEYGGGIVRTINSPVAVRQRSETATELIRSTLQGGNAVGSDVGTSFATPKVTHIAAKLKELYPNEGVNLIRAFIAQGARLPNNHFVTPSFQSIRHFGYGLPSLERVTRNSDYRITFYTTGNIKAEEGHLFSLSIPSELRNQGDEYDILIEVTLAFSAQVRRTRQQTKSYLATWLDWNTSKIGESYEDFKNYALKEISNTATTYDKEMRRAMSGFKWRIGNKKGDRSGIIPELSRSNSTLQKDWATLKSFDLPEEISFSINGHKGWDKDQQAIPYAFTVSIEILGANIPIYELIRAENQVEVESEV